MQDNNEFYKSGYLRPVDIATIGYLSVLSLIILFFHSGLQRWWLYIVIHFSGAGAIFVLIRISRGSSNRVVVFFRDWYAAFLFPPMFEEMDALVHIIFPSSVDQLVIDIDYAIFGVHPTVWLERITTPWLTECLMFCYSTIYFLPYLFGVFVYFKKGPQKFRDLLLAVAFGFYTCYIIFLFFPAEGPWVTMTHLQTFNLKGGFFTGLVDQAQKVGAIRGGAFPSSHVVTAFVVLLFACKYEKAIYYIFLPIILGLFFSTVYCRYHHAIDVIAGLLIGGFTSYLAPKVNRRWESYLLAHSIGSQRH